MATGLSGARRAPHRLTHPVDPGFADLKALVIARTGHHYYADKDDLLWERVAKRLQATGAVDCRDYRERLEDQVFGPPEWRALAAEITIGETFFFRYADQFAALRSTILPDIIARNAQSRRLRVWSAGCATGAEPYSLAILISEALGEELDNWRVSISATDINEEFLRIARAATFGRWPLRSLTPEELQRYFTPGAAAATWQLKSRYRSMVRFSPQNLMEIGSSQWPLSLTEFDLVLCRNVLIYFHHDVVRRLFAGMVDLINPDGWMLIGHAEPNPDFVAFARTVELPGTVAYRPPSDEVEEAAPAIEPEPAGIAPASPAKRVRRKEERPASRAERKPPPLASGLSVPGGALAVPVPDPIAGTPAEAAAAEALRLADAGDLPGAQAYCSAALGEHPTDPALHFYDGVIAAARGENAMAEAAFRRALYLDRSFPAAHYQLALVLLALGRTQAARRSLSNAGRLAADLDPEAEISHLDGMTAGSLTRLVKLSLETSGVISR